jgi:uncharacterized protein YjbI with pentapeptide repeats
LRVRNSSIEGARVRAFGSVVWCALIAMHPTTTHHTTRSKTILTTMPPRRRPLDGPTHAPSKPDLPLEPATDGWTAARLEAADHAEAGLAGLRITDCELHRCNLANVRARGATLTRVAFKGCRLTGITLSDGHLTDVTFDDCRIDLASFSESNFERVVFADCLLVRSDFLAARLHDVRFKRCDMTDIDISDASSRNSELRGCTLDGLRGAASLRNVAMPWGDVIAAAGLFAQALGVRVLSDADSDRG